MSEMMAAAPQGWSAGRRRLATIALAIGYGLNTADRQLLSILAGPIKADLHLSDTQLGLMGGVAFALFYATCGLPLARSEEHTSALPSLMRISYAVFCLKKKRTKKQHSN